MRVAHCSPVPLCSLAVALKSDVARNSVCTSLDVSGAKESRRAPGCLRVFSDPFFCCRFFVRLILVQCPRSSFFVCLFSFVVLFFFTPPPPSPPPPPCVYLFLVSLSLFFLFFFFFSSVLLGVSMFSVFCFFFSFLCALSFFVVFLFCVSQFCLSVVPFLFVVSAEERLTTLMEPTNAKKHPSLNSCESFLLLAILLEAL